MSVTLEGVKFENKPKNKSLFLVILNLLELVLTIFLVITLAAYLLMPEKMEAAVGVSKYLSYQGRLTDNSGNALGGSGTLYCFRFSVYDATSGGSKLWPTGTPTSGTTTVTNGVFNIGVGEKDDLGTFNFYSNDTIYLNVDVNTATTSGAADCGGSWESLAPRQRIDAVGYARVARDVYSDLLRTLYYDSPTNDLVQIGTAAGVASDQVLLQLDVKNAADTIGGACSPSGTIWYNSANTRALVCNNGTVMAFGNPATSTIVAVKEQSAASPITSGTVNFSALGNLTISQTDQTLQFSVGTGGAAGGGFGLSSNMGNTLGNTGTQSMGTFVLSGQGNVTLSQLTGTDGVHTIGISAAGGGAAGVNTFGMSDLGTSTAGISGVITGSAAQFLVVPGAGMIGSQSINGSSATLTLVNSWSTATTASVITNANAVGANAGRFALEGHQHAGVGQFGVSNIGNTAGNTGLQYGNFVLSGNNNITLSQITATGTQTVHTIGISGAAGGPTAYVVSLNGSTGQISVSGGNNITVGNNASTITISGHAQQTGISGISVPSTAYTSGTVVFTGSNNITVTSSGAGQTVIISGANTHAQQTAISGIAINAATTYTSGTVVFSNANNVSFGTNGQTITASASYSQSTAPGGLAVSGIATTFNSGTVQFSAGNLMSLGTAAQAIAISNLLSSATTVSAVASANAVGAMASRFALEGHQHAGVFSFGVSNLGNQGGSTTVFPGQFVLVGSDNITLSQSTAAGNLATISIFGGAGVGGGVAISANAANGSSNFTSGTVTFAAGNANITLSAGGQGISIYGPSPGGGGAATVSQYQWPPHDIITLGNFGQNTVYVAPISFDANISANTAYLLVSYSKATGSVGSFTVDIGIYTLNGSTLSSVASGTRMYSFTSGAGATLSSYTGLRRVSVPLAYSFTPGLYWYAIRFSTGSQAQSISLLGGGMTSYSFSGNMSFGTNSTYQIVPGLGIRTATTASVPATLALSHIAGAVGNARNLVPYILFSNISY